MSHNTWVDEARRVVHQATMEGRQKGLEGPALEKHVRSCYPFGERRMWPYKAWLKAVREKFKPDGHEPIFEHTMLLWETPAAEAEAEEE